MINLNQNLKLPKKFLTYLLTELLIIFGIAVVGYIMNIVGASQFFFWIATVGLVLVIVVCLIIGACAFLLYNSISFMIDDDKLTINSGVIIKQSKTIPFLNIQNISTTSGPLQRIFKISSINIWTASTGQTNNELAHNPDGQLWLHTADATWLKNFIADKQNNKIALS